MTTSQLTLQRLLDALATVPQDAIVKLTGFGSANDPGSLFRHRQFVDGLAITPSFGSGSALEMTAAEYAEYLRISAPGLKWRQSGHTNFVDSHPANNDTPMWIGVPYNVSFNAVTGVEMRKGFAIIRTMNIAPVQGPSLQRISDEEAIERLHRDFELRTGCGRETDRTPSKADQFLLRYIAKDRSTVLQRLAEAREDLATFEASLQDKRHLVARLEADAARHDYLLGISKERPA